MRRVLVPFNLPLITMLSVLNKPDVSLHQRKMEMRRFSSMQDRMGFYNMNPKYAKYLPIVKKTDGREGSKEWVHWTQTPLHSSLLTSHRFW